MNPTKWLKGININVNKKEVAGAAKTIVKESAEIGVETVKTGIHGIISGIIYKAIFFITVVAIVISAATIGTGYAMDALSSESQETPEIQREY